MNTPEMEECFGLSSSCLEPLMSDCETVVREVQKAQRLSQSTSVKHSDLERLLKNDGSKWRSLLTQAYLAGLPTTRGLWSKAAEAIPDASSELEQEVIGYLCLLSTVHHPLALKYPRDLSHSLSCLLWLEGRFLCRGWKKDFFTTIIKKFREKLDNTGAQATLAYKTYILTDSFRDYNTLIADYISALCLQLTASKVFKSSCEVNPENKKNACRDQNSNVCKNEMSPSLEDLEGSHTTLLEATDGITRGTTGLTSWGGAAILVQWLQENKDVIKGKEVLELGSGIGYMVSVMLKSCTSDAPINYSRSGPSFGHSTMNGLCSSDSLGPLSFTATDCHPHVLDLLYHNLALLDSKEAPEQQTLDEHRKELSTKMVKEGLDASWVNPAKPWRAPTKRLLIKDVDTRVVYLDWRSPDLSLVPEVDVILASDIVYAKLLLEPLVLLLRSLLTRTDLYPVDGHKTSRGAAQQRRPASVAYISCTRRNEDTLNEFLTLLLRYRLTYSVAHEGVLESALFFYNESRVPVKIFKITPAADVSYPKDEFA